MDTNSPASAPTPSLNALRPHALMMVQSAPLQMAFGGAMLAGGVWFTPFILPHAMLAAVLGSLSFPIMWRHWLRPNMFLFMLIVGGLVITQNVSNRTFSPAKGGSVDWALLVQFLGVWLIVVSVLILIFRRRIRASLDMESPS